MNRPSLLSTTKSTHKPDAMTFGGHRPPNLEPKVDIVKYNLISLVTILAKN
jgi:hypothetical protein